MEALYRNHMGSDLEVVQDARISFAASAAAVGARTVHIPGEHGPVSRQVPELTERDVNLIGFLARGCRSGEWEEAVSAVREGMSDEDARELLHWARHLPPHWTPFAQQTIKLRMKAPVPIRTHCYKHKVGFVENEESRRYIKSEPELFVPEFRSAPDGDIKQGSGGLHPRHAEWATVYRMVCERSLGTYKTMIEDGVCPEQARFVLPQGVHVNWVWTGSLYAYAHFYIQRCDPHAQKEVRDLAFKVGLIVGTLFPYSWAALTRV